MGKVITLIIIAAIAAGGYFLFFKEPPQYYQHYEKFANHMLRNEYGDAAIMCSGDARAEMEKKGLLTKAFMNSEFKDMAPGKLQGVGRDIISETISPDGNTVDYVISQRVNRAKQGAGMGVWIVSTHTVKLTKNGDNWTIVNFKEEYQNQD